MQKALEQSDAPGSRPLYKPNFVDTLTLLGAPNGEKEDYAYPVTQILPPDEAGPSTRDWLLLYPRELEQKLAFLRRKHGHIAGVIYAGAAEEALSSKCSISSLPLFDERRSLPVPEATVDAGLPVIGFSGERRSRLVQMRQVQQLFWQADYAALAVSACERAYLYGINFHRDHQERLALSLAARLPVDVLLLDEEASETLPGKRLLCSPEDKPEMLVSQALAFF